MEQVWRQAPMPAVRVRAGAGGPQCELNDAALEWQRASGLTMADIEQLALSLETPGDADRLRASGGRRVRCRVVALDDGRLVWFVPGAVPQGRWDAFGALVGIRDRARIVNEFIAWFVGEPGAKLPKRPASAD